MKLIPLIFIICIAVNVQSDEHYTFPPQFHHSSMLSPDRTVYLPPESHTPMPYFPMKNVNLQFPYLPQTVTKPPNYFSSPFPNMKPSTMMSIDNDDDDDDNHNMTPIQKNNRTQMKPPPMPEKREFRVQQNYQPIDRIDMKLPSAFSANRNQEPLKATPRSMIISVPDNHKSDIYEQYKTGSFPGPAFVPAPNIPGVYLSSTTETSVPIIRLSNEMDLDGSFSYEALGADQTHYVQHSRMDNLGNEKQEQVVEGSYSYVGDNGQTYTVNYIADSNGFRASGDHLPVAPPIPEIIQRSIQYNLAEEAKKPPHQKSSWNEENELSQSEKSQRYTISPPRNLFTGKTPESFSFAFSQGVQNSQNNLVAAASNQTPNKANVDFTMDQMKGKTNNGISPQITFLASQGNHVPSTNPQQTIQSIGRPMFSTERTLPQLVNYDAGIKDSEDSNKPLWRWQYGLNANINQENSEKNSISRSFGEGDDVMINFRDMTPQQYTRMIHSQLPSDNNPSQNEQNSYELMKNFYPQNNQAQSANTVFPQQHIAISSTENYYNVNTHGFDEGQYNEGVKINHQVTESSIQKSKAIDVQSNQNVHYVPDIKAKLITQDKLTPASQSVTQSYNYDDMVYEPQRIRPSTLRPPPKPAVIVSSYKENSITDVEINNTQWSKIESAQVSTTSAPMITSTVKTLAFTDFVTNENKNELRPIYKHENEIRQNDMSTSTEETQDIRDNIFLRNLFKTEKMEPVIPNKIKDDSKNVPQALPLQKSDQRLEKSPKFIPMQSSPKVSSQVQPKQYNEVPTLKKKPLDMADIMNFISKNHFESGKTNPKPRPINNDRSEMRVIPITHKHYDDGDDDVEQTPNGMRTNYYQPEEVRGNIKNYKVLQRNNGISQDAEQLKRELSPPPFQMSSSNLPPLGRAGPSMKSYLPPIYV